MAIKTKQNYRICFLSNAKKATSILHFACSACGAVHSCIIKNNSQPRFGWLLFFITRRRPENSDHCV